MPPWSGSALYDVERGRRPRLRWLDRGEFRRRPLIHPPLLSFLPSPDFVGSPLPLRPLLSADIRSRVKFGVLPEVTKDITVEVRPLAHAPLAIFALFKGPPLYLAPFENFHKLHPSLLRRRETLRKSGEGGDLQIMSCRNGKLHWL